MFTQGLKIHHKEEFHRYWAGPAVGPHGAHGVKWGGGVDERGIAPSIGDTR